MLRGVLGGSLVLLGGAVTTPVPASVLHVLFAPLAALGASVPGRMLGLGATVAGLGLLAWVWLVLVRRTAQSPEAVGRRLARVRLASLAWSAPLLVAPPMFSRDGWSYVAQGVMTAQEVSPYVWGPAVLDGPVVAEVEERWLLTPAPYGPLPLLWGAAAAHLTGDPGLLLLAHRVLAMVGLGLLAWALPRIAARAGRDPAFAGALVLPCPLVLAHGVGGLHNDLVMVGLMAAALVVAEDHGWWPAAVLGGLAAAVKLPGGLVCIGVVLLSLPVGATLRGRLLRLAQVAVVSLGTVWSVGATAGVGHGWVHALGVPGQVRTPLSLTTQLGGLVELVGSGAVAAQAVPAARGAGMVAALAVVTVLALRTRCGTPGEAGRSVVVAVAATLLLAPVVHPWYALWCLPLLAALPAPGRVTGAAAVVALVLGVSAPLDSSLEGSAVLIVLTTTLVVAVVVPLLAGAAALGRPGGTAAVPSARPDRHPTPAGTPLKRAG